MTTFSRLVAWNTVKLDDTARCIRSKWLFSPGSNRKIRKVWIKNFPVLRLSRGRVVAHVLHGDTDYWMDVITGSLYDQHGKCLTSDVLHLEDMIDDHDQCVDILLGMRPFWNTPGAG